MPSPITTKVIHGSAGLDGVAKSIARALTAFWNFARPLQSLMNGTWLGHAIHPILTDVVVGAWTITLLFDVVGFFVPSAGLGPAAEIALWLGVLTGLGAIATGATDWKDGYGEELRLGFVHALIMTATTLIYVVSGLIRLGAVDSDGARIVAIVGYVVLTAGSYLGGEMAMAFGSMVDHNAFRGDVREFTTIGTLTGLKEGINFVQLADKPVLVVRKGDRISAVGAVCSHAGGPLQDGELLGDEVECPWHGSRFRVTDGSVRRGPATYPQPHYEVRLSGGQVEIRSRD